MAEWNRTDYARMESAARWETIPLSADPLQGVSPLLLAYLLLALSSLALWRL